MDYDALGNWAFYAFADGYVGYGPISARYAGYGKFRNAPVLQRRSRGRINPNDVSGGPAWRNHPVWVFFGTHTPDCLSALREAYGSDEATVNRAAQGYPYVKAAAEANGISPALLTAIGVRETHFRNEQETAVGHGQGIFQIDDRYHGTARSIGYDPPAAADYAAGLLADRMAHYTGQGYGTEIATAAAVHDYNSSSVHTAGALARGAGNLQRTIRALNGTTTGHNYVSNVLNLAANCFGNASYFSDVPSLESPVGED